MEQTSKTSTAPTEGILGADGEALRYDGSTFSTGVNRLVENNPMLALGTSLGVGLIVGMLIGAAVARD